MASHSKPSRASLKRENEGKACDAVLRIIETKEGHLRESVERPELDPSLPPVELTAYVGDQLFAFEHTLVEAFANQERANERFQQFLEPIRNHFDEGVPYCGEFEVLFPFDMSVGRGNLAKVQQETVAELDRTFARMAAEINSVPSRSEQPHGKKQEVQLVIAGKRVRVVREVHWDLSPAHDGYVGFGRYLEKFVEQQRSDRIETALTKKLPKLAAWNERGARTVLIFETSDIVLSNFSVIGEITITLIAARCDAPDEIYIVSTSLERWSVHCLKRNRQYWPDDEAPVRYWNFRRAELVNLTL